MKKIISLALCLVLSIFVLAGCSNSNEPFEEKSYTPDTQVNEIKMCIRDRVYGLFYQLPPDFRKPQLKRLCFR